jgi:hypothetical protein
LLELYVPSAQRAVAPEGMPAAFVGRRTQSPSTFT